MLNAALLLLAAIGPASFAATHPLLTSASDVADLDQEWRRMHEEAFGADNTDDEEPAA